MQLINSEKKNDSYQNIVNKYNKKNTEIKIKKLL